MRHRYLAFLGFLAILTAVGSLLPVAVEGQVPESGAGTWTPPRTAWGDPDLQGVWSNATTTPWQRPRELAGKEFYTEAEAAARDKQLDGDAQTADTGSAPEWYERGKTVPTRRTSLIIDPPDGRLPPFSEEGKKRNDALAASRRRDAADSWLDRNLPERCLLYRGLPPSPSGQNNNYNIVQTPQYVAILQEHIHEVRIIPTDGRPHGTQRQWLGDSRGRWEGNTLVVETINFYGYDKYYFRVQASIQVSDEYKIVERFTRVSPGMIDYTFTVSDPKTWTRPWTGHLPMLKLEGVAALMFESACHEGNYGMTNILTAARLAEKKAAEEAAKKQPPR